MSKMFNKDGNHLSAKEICLVYGKDEILSVTAEEYAELERQIEIGKQEHEKVGELHSRLEQALTPPTADEVCEELGEYYQTNVTYDEVDWGYRFIVNNNDYIICFKADNTIWIDPCLNDLTCKLYKCIAQFYEKESERE